MQMAKFARTFKRRSALRTKSAVSPDAVANANAATTTSNQYAQEIAAACLLKYRINICLEFFVAVAAASIRMTQSRNHMTMLYYIIAAHCVNNDVEYLI